jgi:hypothetical protein
MQPISMVRRPYLAQAMWLRSVSLMASVVSSCPPAKSATWNLSLHLNVALFLMLPWMTTEFFSGLNPLETLRRYLNDRAWRRQLREREPYVRQRLRLENMKLADEVMRERLEILRIARALDISDQSVATAMARLDCLAQGEPALPPADSEGPSQAPQRDGCDEADS